jgi:hypothetical protein
VSLPSAISVVPSPVVYPVLILPPIFRGMAVLNQEEDRRAQSWG